MSDEIIKKQQEAENLINEILEELSKPTTKESLSEYEREIITEHLKKLRTLAKQKRLKHDDFLMTAIEDFKQDPAKMHIIISEKAKEQYGNEIPENPLLMSEGRTELDPCTLAKYIVYHYNITGVDNRDYYNPLFQTGNGSGYSKSELKTIMYKLIKKVDESIASQKNVPDLIERSFDFIELQAGGYEKDIEYVDIDIENEEDTRLDCVLNELLPIGDLSLFFGGSGCGKTTSVLKMCADISRGYDTFGQAVDKSRNKVRYITFEDKGYKLKKAIKLTGAETPIKFKTSKVKAGVRSSKAILKLLAKFPEDLIILDNLYGFTDTDPFAPMQIVRYCIELQEGAEKLGKHICIVHHSNKQGYSKGSEKASNANASGSAQLINRFATTFEARKEGKYHYVSINKSRYSDQGGDCYDMSTRQLISAAGLSLKDKNEKRQEHAAEIKSKVIEAFKQLSADDLISMSAAEVKALLSIKCDCGERRVQEILKENGITAQRIGGNSFCYKALD